MLFRALLVVFLASVALAHPTKYDRPAVASLSGLPPFRSFHVHVMFQTHNNNSCTGVDNAFAFRDAFLKQFNPSEYVCEGDFDQGRLCMFDPALYDPLLLLHSLMQGSVPFGPFVAPQYGTVVPWVMQNRGNFDVFVHPNTGFEREDHHDWGMWMGQPWVLDLSDPEFTEELYTNGTAPCNSR